MPMSATALACRAPMSARCWRRRRRTGWSNCRRVAATAWKFFPGCGRAMTAASPAACSFTTLSMAPQSAGRRLGRPVLRRERPLPIFWNRAALWVWLHGMKRRHLLGAPLAVGLSSKALAQPAGLPRIGYLSGRSYATDAHLLQAFREGLKSTGFVDGQNVTIDVRWADGRYNQVPAMMAELVATKPNVIAATGGNPVALAAKAATSTLPVVFSAGAEPMDIGLVSNFNRPGGNLTGITLWATELDDKRIDLLREMVPTARTMGLLMNPTNPPAIK